MRTLLLAALTVSSTAISLVDNADACGVPEPQAYVLQKTFGARGVSPTFAFLSEAAPKDAQWRLAAPYSYDNTRVAEAAPLAKQKLTLIGPSGTRVVETSHHVFVEPAWTHSPHGALEIDGVVAEYTFALAGDWSKRVSWIGLDSVPKATAEDDQLLRNHFITIGRSLVRVANVPGTHARVLTARPGGKSVTLVTGSTVEDTRRVDGWPVGAYTLFGTTFLVVDNDGIATTLPIY
jgi:hypothetical protein